MYSDSGEARVARGRGSRVAGQRPRATPPTLASDVPRVWPSQHKYTLRACPAARPTALTAPTSPRTNPQMCGGPAAAGPTQLPCSVQRSGKCERTGMGRRAEPSTRDVQLLLFIVVAGAQREPALYFGVDAHVVLVGRVACVASRTGNICEPLIGPVVLLRATWARSLRDNPREETTPPAQLAPQSISWRSRRARRASANPEGGGTRR